ncbi:MAG: DUF2953 domain-containing protein [Gorillibacterium sp.]|nr:DUF2953 domain-containing protein [Gorillibacterium sp.]
MGWVIGLSLAALLCVAIIALLLSDIRLHVLFVREKSDDRLRIEVKALYGIYRYCFEIPQIDYIKIIQGSHLQTFMKGKGPGISDLPQVNTQASINETQASNINSKQNYKKQFLKSVKIANYKDWFFKTISRIRCSELNWNTRFGLGEPARTASFTGLGWATKSYSVGLMSQVVNFQTVPKLEIHPQFTRYCYETEVEARFSVRIASMAMSGIQLLLRMYRLHDLKKVTRLVKRIRKSKKD